MTSLAGRREEVGTDAPGELAQALARLRPRQRAAEVLRYWEDLSEADIAAVIGCRSERSHLRADARVPPRISE